MILITTDGSERSLQVLPHAVAFADAFGEAITLVRVIEGRESAEQVREQTERALVSAGLSSEALTVAPQRGEDVANAILRTASERGARLIAMATRGQGMLHHAVLGSVALSVLGRADLPVLVSGPAIRPPRRTDGYRLVVTTDGSPDSLSILSALMDMRATEHARIHILSIYVPVLGDDPGAVELSRREERISALLSERLPPGSYDVLVRAAPELTTAETVAINTALDLDASAIAMATKGHSALRHLILGSFAATTIGHSPLPLLLRRA